MIFGNNDIERFFRFLDHPVSMDSCWEFVGAKTSDGYGKMKLNGKLVLAHRFSYRIYNGAFDESLVVMHSCDNPCCVNPAHLSLGTHADNITDRDNKGRFNLGKLYSNSSTGFPGVIWHKQSNKYNARIKTNGKRVSLGLFGTAEEASIAYQQELKKIRCK